MDQEQNVTGSAPIGEAVPKKSPTMLIVGAVIVLVLIAWFVLMKSDGTDTGAENSFPAGVTNGIADTPAPSDADTAALSTQGTSDELDAIEADLNATDLNSLNEIDQI